MAQADVFVGIDVGGTFTDLAMIDGKTGALTTLKVPSTPPAFWPSVIDALDRAAVSPGRQTLVMHGTTVHLNAFLERKGARLALVTTRGFRDVYEMRRGNRPRPYDMHFRYPEPLVKRRDIFEVAERTRADGAVLTAPDQAELAELAAQLRGGDYEAVAICLLHSYRNPENERLVADALREALPGVLIGPSHEVCREWREYERTSTAVINGYASPVLQRYLADLLGALKEKADTRLFLLQSNGGLMRAEGAGGKGVLSLLSGPVGGNVAGRALAAETGLANLICIDMGGTSFEASLIVGGESAQRTEREVGGFPILTPMVDIHTVGAGGGSIAWSDNGALRVGPHSAGARPGPACYGHGGTEPTVTDANIALGRLEDGAAFGDLRLDASLARAAIARFAQGFGLSGEAMAQGILDVINEQMANAIRTITVRRGIDPRNFALVAYGGAGPMHAAEIARLLGIDTVVVPRSAGTFSALGMVSSDLLHDRAETLVASLNEADWALLDARAAAMEEDLIATLRGEGVPEDRIATERVIDLRYVGQENALPITIERPQFVDPARARGHLRDAFDAAYLDVFGHNNPDEAVEIATLRVRATGRMGIATAGARVVADDQPARDRMLPVRFMGTEHPTRFVARTLLTDDALAGPLVVEEATCTTIVPPDFSARLDAHGNLILEWKGDAA